MLRLQKIIIFSLFTPRFFIQKLMSVVELFLRGGNSLQPTYVEGRGEGGSMQNKEWVVKNCMFRVTVLFE